MATSPRPTTPPPSSKPAAEHEPERERRRERDREDKPKIEDREKTPFDDPDMQTIQEEQLKRSAEIEAMGVSKWVEEHDERRGKDRPAPQHGGQVPGVSPTSKDDPGGRR